MAIRSAGDFGEPGELEGTPSLVKDSWLTVSFSASFSRMLVFLRANRSFRGVFGFSDGDAKVWKRLSQWGLMRSLINQMKPGVNLHEDCLGTGS